MDRVQRGVLGPWFVLDILPLGEGEGLHMALSLDRHAPSLDRLALFRGLLKKLARVGWNVRCAGPVKWEIW